MAVGADRDLIAIFPDLWVSVFTDDASVRAASRQYLATVAPMYAFIGLASSMYFSSQGAAKVVVGLAQPPVVVRRHRRLVAVDAPTHRGKFLHACRCIHGGARVLSCTS